MQFGRRASRSRCSRSAGACPPRCSSARCCLRSFRTLMSIAACAVPFSRSVRTLISKHAALAKPIKDLKDLRALRVCACYRHSGPKGPEERKRRFFIARAMARACPSPYGEGAAFFPVARGLVPRERWSARTKSRPGGLSYRGDRQVMFLGPLGPRCL